VIRTVDPDSVGIDPRGLARLDAHVERYVDDRRLAGWQLVISRAGEVAYARTYGLRDIATGAPVRPDTLWRIYSMTKPITAVAAMMLWEEGHFTLTDEISRWLPEFQHPVPIRLWHLLTHTSGLTYWYFDSSPVHARYREAGFDENMTEKFELADACRRLAALPLLFEPGTRWGYSVATDVLGRLIEIMSGQNLADFMAERIFAPLGMTDARWWVDDADAERLAVLYERSTDGRLSRHPTMDAHGRRKPMMNSGGGGVICSAADYQRFTAMLLGKGATDDVRVLNRRTVELMTCNHLPDGEDIDDHTDGVGFGLGVAVIRDPTPFAEPASRGTFYWGGAASTAFWVDPAEELTVEFYTQLVPSVEDEIRPRLRQLVYSALR
jgi:CubicO group peptidase (beta-lactamase class C family)